MLPKPRARTDAAAFVSRRKNRGDAVRRCAPRPIFGAALALCLALSSFSQEPGTAQSPPEAPLGTDFALDVLPVLTRSGCNNGSCHGAALGQKEFKLSLLGAHPRDDWEAITREFRGRRIDRARPEESLILRKPSGKAGKHKGGLALPPDSEGYTIIRTWLEAGAPFRTSDREIARLEVRSENPIRVFAHDTDGTCRDVSRWALFSSNDDSIAQVNETGAVTLKRAGETSVLVRYGGHVGVARFALPHGTVDFEFETRNEIDRFVERRHRSLGLVPAAPCAPETFLRRAMLDILGTLPTPEEVRAYLNSPDPEALVDRLLSRTEFAAYWAYRLSELFPPSQPLYEWLQEGIDADLGWDALARGIILSRGDEPGAAFYRPDNPSRFAEALAQSFLGMRIQCAQCHNHPFARFLRDDYYGLVSFFSRVRLKDGGVVIVPAGEIRNPRTGEVMPPTLPGGTRPKIGADPREPLAGWVARGNPFFARAMVNRIWALLLGEGLVEPVDDLRAGNPASDEGLLDLLAEDFARNGYSLRRTVRFIARSNAYRSLKKPRLLSAEVLVDAIAQATGVPDERRSIQTPARDSHTLDVFGRRKERFEGSLAQALHLISGEAANARLVRMPDFTLEEMFLRTLSRLPRDGEKRSLRTREESEDFMWALLNSKEFMYNH